MYKEASFTISIKSIKYLLYGVILLFIGIFISRLDWYGISQQLIKIGWKFWLIIPVNIIAYLFATLSWKNCMGSEQNNHSVINLFIVRHIGETLAIINPANIVAGDGAKHILLKKNCKDPLVCISSIVLSRILIIMAAILLSGIALSVFFLRFMLYRNSVAIVFVSGTLLILGLWAFWILFTHRKLHIYRILAASLVLFRKNKFVSTLLTRIKHVNYEIALFRQNQKSALVKAFFFAVMHWVMGAIEFWIILHLLSIPVGFLDSLILEMGVAILKSAGSFVPGQIGIEEYGNKIMLSIIGLGSSLIWVSVSILRRLRQFIWLAIGIFFYALQKNN